MSEIAELTAEVKSLRKAVSDHVRTPAGGRNPQTVLGADGPQPAQARDPRLEGSHGFRHPREFLDCVMKAYTDHTLDKRLAPLSAMNIRKAKAAAGVVMKAAGSDEASGANDPYGGFLLPTTWAPDLKTVDPEADPMGAKVTSVPMATPNVRIRARVDKNHTSSVSGGLTVTRRPETVAGTASRMEFETVDLNAHTLFGLSYATEEILMDSPITFTAILSKGFGDQFAYHLTKERISGTGVGEFEGVLNSPALITVSADAGQDADTITYSNVINMRARCWGYGKAIWLANHDTLPQLMRLNQQLGIAGAIVWQPSAREDHPDLLFGRPLIFTEYCKTLGDAGDLLLGNWAEYLEGTYQPLQSEESIHVRFVNHERTFKFWTRNDAKCWWRTALTTVNSSNTLSPFVALAAR